MKIRPVWILLTILGIGLILRLWQLGQVPATLNRDEAALSYNAFLLKETGKDEWGKQWPVALKSFGDYKLIGYPITIISSFFLFGYSDFSVKFPSAFAGTILILLGYLWGRKILKWSEVWSLLLGFLIAVQPVFFFYSRIAFEANLALSLFAGSMLLYFSPAKRSFSKDVVGTILLCAAIFTYNTPLLLLPCIIPLIIWWRGVKSSRKWISAILGMSLVLILGGATLFSLSKQKSGITIFSDEDIWVAFTQYHQQFSGVSQKLFGNKGVFYSGIIGQHYLETFSPLFLVQQGGAHPWHSLPGWGHFYWTTYFFGLIGVAETVYSLIRLILREKIRVGQNKEFKISLLLLFFLLISPLPAVITVDAPHATRSLFFFFMWLVFCVSGVKAVSFLITQKVSQIHSKKLFMGIIIGVLLLEAAEASSYFYHYFHEYQQESVAILKGDFTRTIQPLYKDASISKVAIIDDGGYQYILAAWYLKLSPGEFFNTVQKHLPDKIGFQYGYKLAKFRFVKSPTDIFADEKVLVYWNPVSLQWETKNL